MKKRYIVGLVLAALLTKGLALLGYGLYLLIKYRRERMTHGIVAIVIGGILLAIPVSTSGTKPAATTSHPVTAAKAHVVKHKAPAKKAPVKKSHAKKHVQTVEQKVRGNIATLINESPMELKLKDLQVNDYYGPGNKPGDKIALITLHVGNTDWGGKETREELLKEVVPLFHRLFKIPQMAEVDVSFDVPGVDAYGNNSDIEGAMQINLTRTTAKKMNFDYMEVYYDQFGKMADLYRVVPALNSND